MHNDFPKCTIFSWTLTFPCLVDLTVPNFISHRYRLKARQDFEPLSLTIFLLFEKWITSFSDVSTRDWWVLLSLFFHILITGSSKSIMFFQIYSLSFFRFQTFQDEGPHPGGWLRHPPEASDFDQAQATGRICQQAHGPAPNWSSSGGRSVTGDVNN